MAKRSKLWFSLFALACILSLLSMGSSTLAAGVPPSMAQGFSEIVKKVTPAVVNIAVTGGGEGGRGRRPLPPGHLVVHLVAALQVVMSLVVNYRLLRRCRRALTDGLTRALDPESSLIPTAIS